MEILIHERVKNNRNYVLEIPENRESPQFLTLFRLTRLTRRP